MEQKRIFGIDLFRAISAFSVVCIHTHPFKDINDYVYVAINQGARFAVPFFFITAGYFFGRKLQNNNQDEVFVSYIGRLLYVYVFWSMFYLLIPHSSYTEIFPPIDASIYGRHGLIKGELLAIAGNVGHTTMGQIVFAGVSKHLWFFPSLIMSIMVVFICHKNNLGKYLMPVAIALYVVGLLGGAWSVFSFGVDFTFNTRSGHFFSLLFVYAGYRLSSTTQRHFRKETAYVIFALGMVLNLIEVYVLKGLFGVGEIQTYRLSTVLMGVGVFESALHFSGKAIAADMLALAGRYSLGIYCVHIFIMEIIEAAAPPVPYYIMPFAVYVVSLLCMAMLAKVRFMGKICR
ncbi:MAG: acyltransferase [Nitrospirae bacterium]|nr:acyltransferase [Nitrospirota bacterium]